MINNNKNGDDYFDSQMNWARHHNG